MHPILHISQYLWKYLISLSDLIYLTSSDGGQSKLKFAWSIYCGHTVFPVGMVSDPTLCMLSYTPATKIRIHALPGSTIKHALLGFTIKRALPGSAILRFLYSQHSMSDESLCILMKINFSSPFCMHCTSSKFCPFYGFL